MQGAQVQSLVRELRSTGHNQDPPLPKKKKREEKNEWAGEWAIAWTSIVQASSHRLYSTASLVQDPDSEEIVSDLTEPQ